MAEHLGIEAADRLLTLDEAADIIQMSRSYLSREISKHHLTAFKFGRAVRVFRGDLDVWLRAHRTGQGPACGPGRPEQQECRVMDDGAAERAALAALDDDMTRRG